MGDAGAGATTMGAPLWGVGGQGVKLMFSLSVKSTLDGASAGI